MTTPVCGLACRNRWTRDPVAVDRTRGDRRTRDPVAVDRTRGDRRIADR